MVKTIRKLGKKVDFNSPKIKKPVLGNKSQEIGKRFVEIKQLEERIKKIQKARIRGIVEKEKQIGQEQIELKKIADLWNELGKINLSDLEKEEIIKIINSQKSFTRDLLEHYMNSVKKEKAYIQRIRKT